MHTDYLYNKKIKLVDEETGKIKGKSRGAAPRRESKTEGRVSFVIWNNKCKKYLVRSI